MSGQLEDFAQRYREGFDSYLRDRDERALNVAYELGRSAVTQELSMLDLASAHQDMLLMRLSYEPDRASQKDVLRAAGEFFLEAVSAFEVVRRALQDARETTLIERRHAAILRRLSEFLADASLALDASEPLNEVLQLVADHARELTSADLCAVRLNPDEGAPAIEAFATDENTLGFEPQINELSSLYRALGPPTGSLRMTLSDLDRHRQANALTQPIDMTAWRPRGWMAAAVTTLDRRHLGLIQVCDRQTGDFTDLDEAILVQLAQMASAAVERAQLYRRRPG